MKWKQRQVASCRLGNYLGTISYAENGVPKLVMFWKMWVIQEKIPAPAGEVIGEAVWLPLPAAIQRLNPRAGKIPNLKTGQQRVKPIPLPIEAQPEPQKSRKQRQNLSIILPASRFRWKHIRSRNAKEPQTETQTVQKAALAGAGDCPGKRASIEDERVRDRLLRESEAFRLSWLFWSGAPVRAADHGPRPRMSNSTTFCAAWKPVTLKVACLACMPPSALPCMV